MSSIKKWFPPSWLALYGGFSFSSRLLESPTRRMAVIPELQPSRTLLTPFKLN